MLTALWSRPVALRIQSTPWVASTALHHRFLQTLGPSAPPTAHLAHWVPATLAASLPFNAPKLAPHSESLHLFPHLPGTWHSHNFASWCFPPFSTQAHGLLPGGWLPWPLSILLSHWNWADWLSHSAVHGPVLISLPHLTSTRVCVHLWAHFSIQCLLSRMQAQWQPSFCQTYLPLNLQHQEPCLNPNNCPINFCWPNWRNGWAPILYSVLWTPPVTDQQGWCGV